MNALNPPTRSSRLALFVLFQLYRRRNTGTERFNNLGKDTRLAGGRAWTQTEVCGVPKPATIPEFTVQCVLLRQGGHEQRDPYRRLESVWEQGGPSPQALRTGLGQVGGLGKVTQRSWHLPIYTEVET